MENSTNKELMGGTIKIIDFKFSDEKIQKLRELESLAKNPVLKMMGRECKPERRCLNIGKYYYYEDTNIPQVPWEGYEEMCDGFDSSISQCLVNVYDTNTAYIGWHKDKTKGLALNSNGESWVVSASFAKVKNQEENSDGKPLAIMEFRKGKKGKAEQVPLYHGTVVMFDAIAHEKKGIYHRVPKTLCPRINLTMRSQSD